MKVAPAPIRATIRPPIAGPTARARLKLIPLSAIAAVSSSRATISGMIACHAGAPSAAPMPSAKLSTSTAEVVTAPRIVSTPSRAAATSIQPCERISRRRRSTTSASAPAGSASMKIGRLVAVWIIETISGDGDSEVISHAAPTFCIQVPTLEASPAIQIAKNSRWRIGVQIETAVASRAARLGAGSVGRAPPYAGKLAIVQGRGIVQAAPIWRSTMRSEASPPAASSRRMGSSIGSFESLKVPQWIGTR